MAHDEDYLVAAFAVEVFLQRHVGVHLQFHQVEVLLQVDVEQVLLFAFVTHSETYGYIVGES